MVNIFNIRILTKKDIDELNQRINLLENRLKEGFVHVLRNDVRIIEFEQKFQSGMEFIGRHLPLKRVRKRFRNITKW